MKVPRSMKDVGFLLQDLVNRVSHHGGETLRIMNEIPVTLQQTLLLARLREKIPCTTTDLAAELNLSLPAVSQAINRLVRVGLISRVENSNDRREKHLATTEQAHILLDRIIQARSNEYSRGLSQLPQKYQALLATLLTECLQHLPPRKKK